MANEPIFRGAATALITPLTENGVDYESFGRLIDWQISEGIDALVIAGTSGEGSTLTDEEHRAVLKFCIEKIAGRVPAIAGTGSMKDYEGEIALQAPWAKYRSDICRVAVGEGVTRIGSWAFQGLENLTVAEIPATVTSIGEYAFDSCALTGTVSLPEGLQTIETGAFFNNPDLTCVVLPGSITTIEGEAFASCGLTSVAAAQGVKTEAHVFYYDDCSTDVYIDYVVSVELPQGLSAVSDSAFAYCLSLPRTEPDFILPEGIQTVGEEAFANTAPTFVWIPDSEDGCAVTVEAGAFAACPSLKMIRVPYDCEILGDHAFPAGTLIIGAGGAEKDYANANGYPFIRLCSIGGNG